MPGITTTLSFVLGLALGAGAVALWLAGRLRTERALRMGELAHRDQRLEDQRQAYEARLADLTRTQSQLKTELDALLPQVATRVLGEQSQRLRETAVASVKEAQTPLSEAVATMREQLKETTRQVADFEKERAGAAAKTGEQLAAVVAAEQAVLQQAGKLAEALRSGAQVRGGWGEQSLANLLLACGLAEGRDFDRNRALEGVRERPDFVVKLESGASLVIDCKTPEFTELAAEADEERQRILAGEFAGSLRGMAVELARRDYPAKVTGGAPCVVMFVPSEPAFVLALAANPGLFGELLDKGVVLASPSTIFPLLALLGKTAAERRAESRAREMVAMCRELGDRLGTFLEHLAAVAKAMESGVGAWNKAAASYQSRLEPQMRRLAEINDAFELAGPKGIASAPVAAPAMIEGGPGLREKGGEATRAVGAGSQ